MFKPNISKIIAALSSTIFLIFLIYSFSYWNYLQNVKFSESCSGFGCGPGTMPHLPQFITVPIGEYSFLGGVLVFIGLSLYQNLAINKKKSSKKISSIFNR